MEFQKTTTDPVVSPTGAPHPSVTVAITELAEHDESVGIPWTELLRLSGKQASLKQPLRGFRETGTSVAPAQVDFLFMQGKFTLPVDVHCFRGVPRTVTPNAWIDRYPDPDRESLKQEVYALLKQAGAENWDGEGALALARETADIAQKLIDQFPGYVARPDVAATPHGEVDFDWVIAQDMMLTISIGPSREIAFSGLFQGARWNGCEPWTGRLPQFVHCCFERLRSAQTE